MGLLDEDLPDPVAAHNFACSPAHGSGKLFPILLNHSSWNLYLDLLVTLVDHIGAKDLFTRFLCLLTP